LVLPFSPLSAIYHFGFWNVPTTTPTNQSLYVFSLPFLA
jgi:hypothetical protein